MGKWTEMKEMRERGSRSYGEKSKAKKMLAELKEMIEDVHSLAEEICDEIDSNYKEKRRWNIEEE